MLTLRKPGNTAIFAFRHDGDRTAAMSKRGVRICDASLGYEQAELLSASSDEQDE